MSLCVCTLHTLLPSQITENEGFSNSNNIATQEQNDIVVIFTRSLLCPAYIRVSAQEMICAAKQQLVLHT